jgi:hypothetical protein
LGNTKRGHKNLDYRLALVFFVVIVVAVVARFVVLVDTARLFVIHLDAHLDVAFVEKVHQATDLNAVVAGELPSSRSGGYILPSLSYTTYITSLEIGPEKSRETNPYHGIRASPTASPKPCPVKAPN